MDYIDRLIKLCERAKESRPRKKFLMSDMSQLDGIKNAIYVIEDVGGDIHKTFSDFENYKKCNKTTLALPKSNSPSRVMYVGSSTSGIKRRLQQHMGNGPKATYALHLQLWFKGEYKITVRVYDEPIEVLQIIEDALSDELKPAFGKKGGNNK